jgi:hypothetical protein
MVFDTVKVDWLSTIILKDRITASRLQVELHYKKQPLLKQQQCSLHLWQQPCNFAIKFLPI